MRWDNNSLESVYSLQELIGSTVRVQSRRVTQGLFCGRTHKIENIVFKVTIDGKLFPLVKLNNFPEYLSPQDLEIIEIPKKVSYLPAVCGEVLCSETLCGLGVSSSPTVDQGSGLSIKDSNGVLISNRVINILNSDVETLEGDLDNTTDININIIGKDLD